MRVAHLADLHLGHPGPGTAPALRGDADRAFRRAAAAVVGVQPDAVLIVGDVFDSPRPPPGAVRAFRRGLATLRKGLPGAPILVVAGARDTPLSPREPSPLAILPPLPGVRIAAVGIRRVRLPDGETSVLLVPRRALTGPRPPDLVPDPRARRNVAALHVERVGEGDGSPVLDPAAWDYVALGGEHRAREVTRGVWFAGSLERVGPRPWPEAGDGKGFLVVELATGEVRLHPVPARPVVDLAPVDARGGDAARIDARIREAVEAVPGGIDGKVVRLRLVGPGRETLRRLDRGYLAACRRRAGLFRVEVVAPPGPSASGSLVELLRRGDAGRRVGDGGPEPGAPTGGGPGSPGAGEGSGAA